MSLNVICSYIPHLLVCASMCVGHYCEGSVVRVCACSMRVCLSVCVCACVCLDARKNNKGFLEGGWLLATTPGGTDPQPVK